MYTIVFQLGSSCNLRCKYCRERPLLERDVRVSLRKYGAFCEAIRSGIPKKQLEHFARTAHFIFGGGEPMMASASHYADLLRVEDRVFSPYPIQRHSLQTNLTLLDRKWIDLLKSERHRLFLGVSYDVVGDSRVFKNGRLSNDAVRRKIEILKKNDIPFGVNCVIDSKALRRMQEAIDAFERDGIDFRFQLIQDKEGEFSAEEYAEIFLEAFRRYYMNAESRVVWMNSVAYILDLIKGNEHSFVCTHVPCAGWLLFVLANGDVTHCPAMYEVEIGNECEPTLYGNLLKDGFRKILSSRKRKGMIRGFDYVSRNDPGCRSCSERSICAHGCRADVVSEGRDPSKQKSIFWCSANRKIYPEMREFIKKHPVPENPRLCSALNNEGIV